jgi:hypothetical protein
LLERDRKGDIRDLTEEGDPVFNRLTEDGDPVFNRLSGKEAGDLVVILGSTCFICFRSLGVAWPIILSQETSFEFSSRDFKEINTFSSGSGANPKKRLL